MALPEPPPDRREYTHLALIPTYTEPLEKLRETVRALAEADWPKERKICAIITRETDADGIANVRILREEFGDAFARASSTSSIRWSRGSWSARAAPWPGAAATCIGSWCASGGWIRGASWSPTSTPTIACTRSTSTT